MPIRLIALAFLAALTVPAWLPHSAAAADRPSFLITIKDHKFSPAEITVPAGQQVELVIENKDATPEEFESRTLRREKVVQPNGKISILIGPLKPGTYPFVGEFHEDSAKGKLIAK